MEDVQNRHDYREIAINRVGATDLQSPVVVLDREQQTLLRPPTITRF